MPQLYTLDGAIQEFFESRTSSSRAECDSIARSLVGDPVEPVQVQGAWSYTVIAGKQQQQLIIQFRAQKSLLDMDLLGLASQIHPGVVPTARYHGEVGGHRPLAIYIIDKVPGIPYIMANPDGHTTLRSNTIRDYARFFAQSWNSPVDMSASQQQTVRMKLEDKLDKLSTSEDLAERFQQTITRLKESLSLLFTTKDYPFVLTHGDLCELNVFVDPDSLHVTGVIDWAEATIMPFGLALYGVLHVLGWMDSSGWHYHPDYTDLIRQFWTTFEEEVIDGNGGDSLSEQHKLAIRVACTIGIFLQRGYTWDGQGDGRRVARKSDDCFRYLDAWFGAGREENGFLF